MKTDDLTRVKYIGASRMKSLKDSGITTIRQLYEAPVEQLARIPTIGRHYAELIKTAVAKVYPGKDGETVLKTLHGKEPAIEGAGQDLEKKIKVLRRRLNHAIEDLKGLKEKNHTKLHINFKKRSRTLLNRLKELSETRKDLTDKFSKNLIEKIDALNALSKNAGKDLKKKKIKRISRKIRSFSRSLKKANMSNITDIDR